MSCKWSRRQLLGAAGSGLIAFSGRPGRAAAGPLNRPDPDPRFQYSLNTATLRGRKLPLDELIEIAAAAGYDAIEPWVDEIRRYEQSGGRPADVKKRVTDHGLKVVNAVGFARWMVDDRRQRAEGLEAMRRDMDLVRRIGGTRIAAPPAGATRKQLDLLKVAERYRRLLEIGQEIGVQPQLEMWGASKTLGRLGELAFVAVECGRPDAGLLPDVFHIYKGGSDFSGLRYLNGRMIHVFHMNDYPADRARHEATDADRVFPGDGAAPMTRILKHLRAAGFGGVLSIELFNRDYWKRDPAQVAREGLEKMKRVVRAAVQEASG